MKLVLWIGALIIAPFVIAKVDLWRRRGIGEAWGWWETENMPHELRTATLFLSEQDIATSLPSVQRPRRQLRLRQDCD